MADSKNPDMQHERSEPHGNTAHGGSRALARLRAGQPLDGPAYEKMREAMDDYAEVGAAGMIEISGLELAGLQRLFLESCGNAAALGQWDRFFKTVRTWGYLKDKEMRAWQLVLENQREDSADIVVDAIAVAKSATESPETRQDAPGRAE